MLLRVDVSLLIPTIGVQINEESGVPTRLACLIDRNLFLLRLVRLQLDPPCRAEMIALDLNNFETAFFHNLLDILVPPAPVLVRVRRCVVI